MSSTLALRLFDKSFQVARILIPHEIHDFIKDMTKRDIMEEEIQRLEATAAQLRIDLEKIETTITVMRGVKDNRPVNAIASPPTRQWGDTHGWSDERRRKMSERMRAAWAKNKEKGPGSKR